MSDVNIPVLGSLEVEENITAVNVYSGNFVPIVVKTTEPTAADYGEDNIPINAIWIQIP